MDLVVEIIAAVIFVSVTGIAFAGWLRLRASEEDQKHVSAWDADNEDF